MFNTKKIKELELRIWALENPCKFKIGQKLKGNRLVIDVQPFQEEEPIIDWYIKYWKITYLLNGKKEVYNQGELERFISNTK